MDGVKVWQIENYTPYRASGAIVVDGNGAKHWVVAVRGTFTVNRDGRIDIAEEQSDPLLVPVYRGEDGLSSLLYEADVIAEKPLVDILVNGSAFAPGGTPVRDVTIGLRTSFFQKSLVVKGDRVWQRNWIGRITPSQPDVFVEMPVTYERAYGGFDRSNPNPKKQRMFAPNPVGTGVCIRKKDLVGKPVANVEFLGAARRARSAAGFGPICSYWAPRAQYAGTYDSEWMEKCKPLLPWDFDNRFFNCAPEDQQIQGRYPGGDRIEVTNMSPEGTFVFTVPEIVLGFKTYFSKKGGGQSIEHHRSSIKTVIVEPGKKQFIVVWQSTLSCHNKIADLDETVIREKRKIR
jgi:hypothetical protein